MNKQIITPRNAEGYLPIMQVETEIRASISNNQYTVIDTPTGSGKTMLTPAWANFISGRTVYVLVPRVVIAREAEQGSKNLVFRNGYEVAHATGRSDSNATRAKVVYITEGSFIHRDIQKRLVAGDVVCVDEVHEQGSTTEAILYLSKGWAKRGIKVVLMSATMDVEKYVKFFTKDGFSVGTVKLPPTERPFTLTFEVVDTPLKAIAQAAANGGRCLVGVDGKDAIEKLTIEISKYLKEIGSYVKVFGYHGEMEQEDQDLVFRSKGAMVVVGTNVLQSGVTIDGLTHEYITGKGKRIELQKGRKTLASYDLSQAEMGQWFGRVGRTCNGTIYWTAEEAEAFAERDAMPIAEILRSPLEETILMFNSIGINIRNVELLNKPNITNIDDAYARLQRMGLVDTNDQNTKLGNEVFSLGVGLRGGIITILGEQFGIANTSRKIAALVSRDHFCRKVNYHYFQKSIEGLEFSDHLCWVAITEYFINKYGYRPSNADFEAFKVETEDSGCFRKNLLSIMKQFEYIDGNWNSRLQCLDGAKDEVTEAEYVKDAIIRIMKVAYSDSTFVTNGYCWQSEDGLDLQQSNSSNASVENAISICGDITRIEANRGRILNFFEGVTVLEEHLPVTELGEARFDYDNNKVVVDTVTRVNNRVVSRGTTEATPSKETTSILLKGLISRLGLSNSKEFDSILSDNKTFIEKIQRLNIRADYKYGSFGIPTIVDFYLRIVGGVDYTTLKEIEEDFSMEEFKISFEDLDLPFDSLEEMEDEIIMNY